MPRVPCLTLELKCAACLDSERGLTGENRSWQQERPQCLIYLSNPIVCSGWEKKTAGFQRTEEQ